MNTIDGPTKLVRQDAILGGLSIGQLPFKSDLDLEPKWLIDSFFTAYTQHLSQVLCESFKECWRYGADKIHRLKHLTFKCDLVTDSHNLVYITLLGKDKSNEGNVTKYRPISSLINNKNSNNNNNNNNNNNTTPTTTTTTTTTTITFIKSWLYTTKTTYKIL